MERLHKKIFDNNGPRLEPRNRGSHRKCSVRKGILRIFAKLTGKQLCQSLFFNKVAGEFWEISKKPFLQNTSRRVLL